MARRTKDASGRLTAGRVTPKTGKAAPQAYPEATNRGGHTTVNQSGTAKHVGRTEATRRSAGGRYTAPIPDEYRSSPWWVLAAMLGCFAVGLIGILLNYLSLLPGGPSNFYLLAGLGLFVVGFIIATRYH